MDFSIDLTKVATWVNYLNALSLSHQILTRMDSLFQTISSFLTEEISDLFVSDYLQGDGSKIYQNLYLFTEQKIIIIPNFVTANEIFLQTLSSYILYLRINYQDYDFTDTKETSRLSVIISLIGSQQEYVIDTNLKASGKNCDYLKRILIKYLVPNLVPPDSLEKMSANIVNAIHTLK